MSDLISRQAVENITWEEPSYTDPLNVLTEVREKVRALPSVENKCKTGHWIKTISENGITSAVRCSECGFEDNRYMLFRYCPNCGADMKGGE